MKMNKDQFFSILKKGGVKNIKIGNQKFYSKTINTGITIDELMKNFKKNKNNPVIREVRNKVLESYAIFLEYNIYNIAIVKNSHNESKKLNPTKGYIIHNLYTGSKNYPVKGEIIDGSGRSGVSVYIPYEENEKFLKFLRAEAGKAPAENTIIYTMVESAFAGNKN